MWQSRYTDHGIMSSKFRDGKGMSLGTSQNHAANTDWNSVYIFHRQTFIR